MCVLFVVTETGEVANAATYLSTINFANITTADRQKLYLNNKEGTQPDATITVY
jgi:hypothetical protein